MAAFDWNRVDPPRRWLRPGVTFLDETLRDGIQNPSVTDPQTEDKLALIHCMDRIGIHTVNVGLPAASTIWWASPLGRFLTAWSVPLESTAITRA